MTKVSVFISGLFLFIFSVWSTLAQDDCAFDVSSVINRVSEACDDIEENQILPAGETQIRLKETSQGGFFLLASFTF